MSSIIHTIGHSNHSADAFVELLESQHITAVADVRSSPFSRFNPQFNRELMQKILGRAGIEYIFLGQELGARAKDRSSYVGGRVCYDRLAATPLFQRGLERIAESSRRHRIALLCAEKDPLMCHRAILISRHLELEGFPVQHILEDATLESHPDAVCRLLQELDLPEHDLFRGRGEMIEEAYRRRGEEIAYAEETQAEEKGGQ